MSKSLEYIPKTYPTDSYGVPVSPFELGYDEVPGERHNNHHMAFYARLFGSTAISLAFRNLEVMQVEMNYDQHVDLHRKYLGIKLPSQDVMLENIEMQEAIGGQYKIFNMQTKEYEFSGIVNTDDLKREYRSVA